MATPHVAPPTKKVKKKRVGHFAQRKYQAKQKEAGNCRGCGKPRPPELKQLCRTCQDKQNAYMSSYRAKKRAADAETVVAVSEIPVPGTLAISEQVPYVAAEEGEESGTIE